jgi:hypothetical protein
MIYGGTNWGNIGQPSGYTSYDYGAVSFMLTVADNLIVDRRSKKTGPSREKNTAKQNYKPSF